MYWRFTYISLACLFCVPCYSLHTYHLCSSPLFSADIPTRFTYTESCSKVYFTGVLSKSSLHIFSTSIFATLYTSTYSLSSFSTSYPYTENWSKVVYWHCTYIPFVHILCIHISYYLHTYMFLVYLHTYKPLLTFFSYTLYPQNL